MTEEDTLFIKKIKEAINNAYNGKITVTNFLNLHEIELAKGLLNNDINYCFDGGYSDAEYKRLIISPLDINPDHKIIIFKISYNKKYVSFSHKHILGNLMALGIKRDTIGDCIVGENIYFIAKKELKTFFLNEIHTINGFPVKLEEVSSIDESEITDDYVLKNIFSKSLRLDAIVSLASNISREASQELIELEKVKVNQSLTKNNTYQVKKGDLISIRTKGRVIIDDILGNTKSGRITIALKLYK